MQPASPPRAEEVPIVGQLTGPPALPTDSIPPAGSVTVAKLSALQTVATWFAGVTGLVLAVILVYTTAFWVNDVRPAPDVPTPPALPTIAPNANPTEVAQNQLVSQALIANYKSLSDVVITSSKARSDNYASNRTQLLSAVPTQFLYPFLTLIIGYLFGIHSTPGSSTS